MITAALADLSSRMALTPNLRRALDFLAAHPTGEGLAERVEIDGKQVYAMLQVFETVMEATTLELEAHRKYIDIQYVVSGEEVMGWAHLSTLRDLSEYNPEKDVQTGSLPAYEVSPVLIRAGQAAVFFPEDAHAPKLAWGKPGMVKKIVVKVGI